MTPSKDSIKQTPIGKRKTKGIKEQILESEIIDRYLKTANIKELEACKDKFEGIKIEDMDFCQFIDLLKQDNIELERQEIKAIRKFGEQYHGLKQRIQTAKDLKENSLNFQQKFSNTYEISTSKYCLFNYNQNQKRRSLSKKSR